MPSAPIPVVLFAYNRADTLKRTLQCLKRDRVPLLYAFCDGPRTPAQAAGVADVLKVLRSIDWCETVITVRPINLGLGKSVVWGVTEVLEKHESAIVFEDDLVCVQGTYDYLCAALNRYRSDTAVMSVTGWTHPRVTPKKNGDSPYLDGRAECWSWGTWRRAWTGMQSTDALTLIKECKANNIWPKKYGDDLPAMAAVEHAKNIWAVRWLYWHIVRGGLCVRPPRSLIEHEGIGPEATNVQSNNDGWQNPPIGPCPPIPTEWPEPVEHPSVVKLWRKACKHKPTWRRRIEKRIAELRQWIHPPKKGQEPLPVGGDVTFSGSYPSWDDAAKACDGYSDATIVNQVLDAARRVQKGEAAYERDGMTFDEPEYPWPVVAAILDASQRLGKPVTVVDFGGSLGSTYFQTRALLGRSVVARWCVVEQPGFVEAGQREFSDGILSFHDRLDDPAIPSPVDVLLLSAVMHYLPNPHEWLDRFVGMRPEQIVVDRTPFWPGDDREDGLVLQTVSAVIYAARYPAWFFKRSQFLDHFDRAYETVASFAALDIFRWENVTVPCQGFIFRLKRPPEIPSH